MCSGSHCEAARLCTHLVNFHTKNVFSTADETETITQLCIGTSSAYIYTKHHEQRLEPKEYWASTVEPGVESDSYQTDKLTILQTFVSDAKADSRVCSFYQ